MAKFGLIQSFEIDDGQLDGITPEKAFVLGIEWQTIYAAAKRRKPATLICRSENKNRIQSMLDKLNRPHRWIWSSADDPSESWLTLVLEGVTTRPTP